MCYLICKKCGKYYKLKKGDSPEDMAKKCHFGGSLKYVQNFDMHITDELDPLN